MLDVASFPIHQVLGVFTGNNLIYTLVGVGGFMLSTVGSLLIRCVVYRRSNKKKLQKHQEEIQDVTKKVLQDTIKSHNIAILDITKHDLEPISKDAPAILTTVNETKTKKVP